MNEAYDKGFVDEAKNLAVWRSGEQFVGTQATPLEAYLRNRTSLQAYDPPVKEVTPR